MLAVDPNYGNQGLGLKLMMAAEQKGVENDCKKFGLVNMVPKTHEDSNRVILAKWYEKLGYTEGETKESKMEKNHLLKFPVVFTEYWKNV